jgi:hypothetical protein
MTKLAFPDFLRGDHRIYFHLPVDGFPVYQELCDISTCICFSSGVPAIFPNLMNQRRFSGFHLPPAALACSRIGMSEARCAEAQACPGYIAEGAASSRLFRRPTRLSSAAAAASRHTGSGRTAGRRRTSSPGFSRPAAPVLRSAAFSLSLQDNSAPLRSLQ